MAQGMLGRLRSGLKKTRDALSLRVVEVVAGKKTIDEELFEDLEEAMLEADLGVAITDKLLTAVNERVRQERVSSPDVVRDLLKQEAERLLGEGVSAGPVAITHDPLHVVLIIGVNGVGKTTTVGKLAHWHARHGRNVLIGAADTFRAAAIEQLAEWARRSDSRLVRHHDGADPAAVVYDAVEAARAGGYQVVLIDTAGRLHTRDNLMAELDKVRRVIAGQVAGAPHETLLVLDGTTGQNAVTQARQFSDRIGVTGLVVTKVDGTARGGAVAAIAQDLKLPVRFVGTGESIDDLLEFDAKAFADALFG